VPCCPETDGVEVDENAPRAAAGVDLAEAAAAARRPILIVIPAHPPPKFTDGSRKASAECSEGGIYEGVQTRQRSRQDTPAASPRGGGSQQIRSLHR
jgi:hypothetical protein